MNLWSAIIYGLIAIILIAIVLRIGCKIIFKTYFEERKAAEKKGENHEQISSRSKKRKT